MPSVSSSDDAGNLLDALNQVGQATGVSMDTLSQDLAKNAGQFQAMGLSAEQAAGFMGAVEMSGLDTSTMLTGLTKAQKVATKNGQSLSDALKDFSKTMSSNATDTTRSFRQPMICSAPGQVARSTTRCRAESYPLLNSLPRSGIMPGR
jgi:phage-related minor tail protein